MKIKLLKSGGYSFSSVGYPAIMVTEEQAGSEFFVKELKTIGEHKELVSLSDLQALSMIADKWAEDVAVEDEEEPEDVEPEDPENPEDPDPENPIDPVDPEEEIDDVEAHLNELVKDKSEDEAKQILQDWGKVRLDITVSKSFTIENMITKLVESA